MYLGQEESVVKDGEGSGEEKETEEGKKKEKAQLVFLRELGILRQLELRVGRVNGVRRQLRQEEEEEAWLREVEAQEESKEEQEREGKLFI